jgi:hypothetical protein
MKNLRVWLFSMGVFIFTSFFFEVAFAADSLNDAIKNGKISGEAKIWYQTNDRNPNDIFDKEGSIFSAGIRLGFITQIFKGFGAGVNFYSVDDLNAYENFANNSTHGVPHDETWAWLGEAYLTYQLGNTQAKIGRQNITSPLINSDTWALFPNNFEAYAITNSNLPDTTLNITYVTEERKLASEQFDEIAEHGVLMLAAVNKSIPKTDLSAYYYYLNDENSSYYSPLIDNLSAVYLEAKTKICKLNVGAQFMLLDPDNGLDETEAYGAILSTELHIFNASVAFSSVGGDATKNSLRAATLSDNGTKTPLYTATVSGDGDISGAVGTDAVKISVGVKPTEALAITINHGFYNHTGDAIAALRREKSTSNELVVSYTGIKNVSMTAFYFYTDHNTVGAYRGHDANDELSSVRFVAAYNF